MKIQILDKTKKRKTMEGLSYLGELKMNEMFIRTGDRIRIFSGNLTNEQLMKIWSLFPIEGVGLYFAKDFVDKRGARETRLSVDGIHRIKDQITENIMEITKEQLDKWFYGETLELNEEQKQKFKDYRGFVSLKYGEDFVGTAKLTSQNALLNFLPKERRIKK